MKYRSMCVILLAGAVLLCMGACTAEEALGNNWNTIEDKSAERIEVAVITQAPSENLPDIPSAFQTPIPSAALPRPSVTVPGAASGPVGEAVPAKALASWVPVLTELWIEAGSKLSVSDFFASEEEVPGEGVFLIRRGLTEEELRQAGAVYELDVSYAGQPLTVTVGIVDTTPPIISGANDIEVFAGDTISYKKGVQWTDNAAGEVTLSIEHGQVDLETPGAYPVRYTATDAAGNSSSFEVTVFIKARSDKDKIADELADALILQLITEDMSKWDTCYQLWNWCRTKISYSYSAGDRSSIYAGAYEGLHGRSGDCYVYYATFTLLLQKCGIETMEIRRAGGISDHWWNLVNLGDGWYHCDSSPRKKGDRYRCFMQTDAQVQAYTKTRTDHPNYYVFDETLYPERATEIVYGE